MDEHPQQPPVYQSVLEDTVTNPFSTKRHALLDAMLSQRR